MKKQINKLCILILSVALALSILPFGEFTATAETQGIFNYYIHDGQAIISGVTNKDISGELVIPSTLGGSPVAAIDWFAFSGCTELTKITVPDNINYIDDWAFSDCEKLMEINIPSGITAIHEGTFCGCASLKSIIIPNSVVAIGYNAFGGCTQLSDISVPDSVTSIADKAFIDTAYYSDMSNWEDGVLYICNCLISANKDISGTYSIKSGTRIIAKEAFLDCSGLKSVTIPESVTAIGERAFKNCSGLSSVALPNSVERIEYATFESCTGLKDVILPKSVTVIDCAFSYCESITDVYYTGPKSQRPEFYVYGNEYLSDAKWHYNYAPHISGDVNKDGEVNNKDLTRLFRYLSDWEIEVDEAALDINGDGETNNKDLTRLFRYLSDWDVEIF